MEQYAGQSEKWRCIDEELEITMRCPVEALDAMEAKMQQSEAEFVALDNMCQIAVGELLGVNDVTPACEDVLEHCVRAIADIKRVYIDVMKKLEGTRRFVAGAVLEHHDSVMPYMTNEEVQILHQYNPFVVR
jgi:hypothetical protein